MCGGIAGIKCCSGLICKLSGFHLADASGTCIKGGLKGDFNNDGRVNVIDLGILLSDWNSATKPSADINQDGRVNVIDLGIMLSSWE